MKKNDSAHEIQIHLEHNTAGKTVTVKHARCSCVAGQQGSCNHCFAALYLISHCSMCGIKAVPEYCCTMLPQKWHIPRSIMKAETVMQSARLDPLKDRSKAGKREAAITCTLYEARRNKIPIHPDTISNVQQRLANINARIPFVHLLQTTPNNLVNTQLGAFPEGSVCSYQLANMEPGFEVIGSFDATTNITLDKDTQHGIDQCIFPPFPLVTLDQKVISPEITTKLNSQQKIILDEVTIPSATVNVIEAQTREQRQCEDWANVRKFRLNSSTHRQILHRRKITRKFCVELNKPIHPTRAMQHGINNEDKGKYYYSRATGNTVLPCGYVVDESAPWLGTSPDGKVVNTRLSQPFGLLEVKCPYKWKDSKPSDACADPSFYCSIDENGKPFLKENTDYFQQVQSQMGITGAQWCDIAFLFNKGLLIIRVLFLKQHWLDCKENLTSFYFRHFLKHVSSENA